MFGTNAHERFLNRKKKSDSRPDSVDISGEEAKSYLLELQNDLGEQENINILKMLYAAAYDNAEIQESIAVENPIGFLSQFLGPDSMPEIKLAALQLLAVTMPEDTTNFVNDKVLQVVSRIIKPDDAEYEESQEFDLYIPDIILYEHVISFFQKLLQKQKKKSNKTSLQLIKHDNIQYLSHIPDKYFIYLQVLNDIEEDQKKDMVFMRAMQKTLDHDLEFVPIYNEDIQTKTEKLEEIRKDHMMVNILEQIDLALEKKKLILQVLKNYKVVEQISKFNQKLYNDALENCVGDNYDEKIQNLISDNGKIISIIDKLPDNEKEIILEQFNIEPESLVNIFPNTDILKVKEGEDSNLKYFIRLDKTTKSYLFELQQVFDQDYRSPIIYAQGEIIKLVTNCFKLLPELIDHLKSSPIGKKSSMFLFECFDTRMKYLRQYLLYDKSVELSIAAMNFITSIAHYGKPLTLTIVATGVLGPIVSFSKSSDHGIKNAASNALMSLTEKEPSLPKSMADLTSKSTKLRHAAGRHLSNRAILYVKVRPGDRILQDKPQTAFQKMSNFTSGIQQYVSGISEYEMVENYTGMDQYRFYTNLVIGNIRVQDILNVHETSLVNFLPLIANLVREHTALLNQDQENRGKEEYDITINNIQARYLREVWDDVIDALIVRIGGSNTISQYLAWYEEVDCGLRCKTDDITDILDFDIVVCHDSIKKIRTLEFWEKVAYNIIERKFASKGEKNRTDVIYTHTNFNKKSAKYFDTSKGEGNIELMDPISPNEGDEILKIRKKKVYNRKAIFSIKKYDGIDIRNETVLLRTGEDMRPDMLSQQMFHIFNLIWENSPIRESEKPFINVYKVVPLAFHFALEEHLLGCVKITKYDWSMENASPIAIENILRSAAGAFLSIRILGIRDRKPANMLVCESYGREHRVVIVDLENTFNETINNKYRKRSRFPIPSGMREGLMKIGKWETFKDMCAGAYLHIQNHALTLINTCLRLFNVMIMDSDHYSETHIRNLLLTSLKINIPPSEAFNQIREEIEKGSAKWDGQLKKRRKRKTKPEKSKNSTAVYRIKQRKGSTTRNKKSKKNGSSVYSNNAYELIRNETIKRREKSKRAPASSSDFLQFSNSVEINTNVENPDFLKDHHHTHFSSTERIVPPDPEYPDPESPDPESPDPSWSFEKIADWARNKGHNDVADLIQKEKLSGEVWSMLTDDIVNDLSDNVEPLGSKFTIISLAKMLRI
eukprot:TRINITY_DN794_c0_g1_i1.p1 TRINITY_DN794_c0_g1~~TRINITY_DN794_c0_g1_i1.p1  ORF type:complete len:1232 (-),score=279.94 TRINITY_DN794_c0_g1_i1:42-3737(-)